MRNEGTFLPSKESTHRWLRPIHSKLRSDCIFFPCISLGHSVKCRRQPNAARRRAEDFKLSNRSARESVSFHTAVYRLLGEEAVTLIAFLITNTCERRSGV